MSGGSILLDDMEIKVCAAWFSPKPLGRNDYKVTTLYVKNIPENTHTKQLKKLFQQHGEVTDVVMPTTTSGGKPDFGFVHYADRSSALEAVKDKEKYEVEGQVLEVVLAEPQAERKFDTTAPHSSAPLPNFIPTPGYGRFPVHPYGPVFAGYGAATAGFQQCSTSLPQVSIEGKILEQEIEEMDTEGEDKSSSSDDDGKSPIDESEGGIIEQEIEEMDTGGEDMSSAADDDESHVDDKSGDVLSSSLNCSWCLRSHKNIPWDSPAVEIFSVFIGQEKSKAVQIYGSIEVLSDDREVCYIFKRDENDALGLSTNLKSIPIPDGSRVFDDCSALKMKFDIKDVDSCLAIKGYVHWAASKFDSDILYEKQLCSVIQGQHGGFAAVHYSIFSDAVRVTIKVSLHLRAGSFDVHPDVWGSLITQYSRYDYSSRYNKDYYRSVLFKRTQDDLVQVSNDSTIPLTRSTIVVPSYSSLIVNVDLSVGASGKKLSCAKMIEIGEGFKTVETEDYVLRIELDWCEIK